LYGRRSCGVMTADTFGLFETRYVENSHRHSSEAARDSGGRRGHPSQADAFDYSRSCAMGSTRIRALTESRRPCGGLRAIPMSRSGQATSCQSPLRSGVWKSGQPGGNFSVEKLVGTDDVIYRKSPATLPGNTYSYMRRVFLTRGPHCRRSLVRTSAG
jgi:hypothetical protein